MRERRRVDERLERRARLPPAAHRAVEGAARVVGAADHREDVAGRRIDRDERRLESRAVAAARARPRPPAPRRPAPPAGTSCAPASRADGRRRTRCGTAGAGSPWPSRRARRSAGGTAGSRGRTRARRLFLRRRDEPLLAHLRQHDVAALERAVVVRPGRQRRRRANQPGDERRLRQRQRAAPACETDARDIVSTP